MVELIGGARIAARVALVAVVVAIGWLSLAPSSGVPPTFGISDKVLHAVGYAVFGALAVLAGLRVWAAILAAMALGLVLEVLQGLGGYRTFEWVDLVADVAGAAVGALVASWALARTSSARRSR